MGRTQEAPTKEAAIVAMISRAREPRNPGGSGTQIERKDQSGGRFLDSCFPRSRSSL